MSAVHSSFILYRWTTFLTIANKERHGSQHVSWLSKQWHLFASALLDQTTKEKVCVYYLFVVIGITGMHDGRYVREKEEEGKEGKEIMGE